MRKNILLWGVQILVGGLFLMAGAFKLAGAPPMVAEFEAIGLGQWLRYLTGFLEVAGAALLWTPRYSALGGAALAIVMVGAVLTHLLILGGSPVPAAVLGMLSFFIAWERREQYDRLWLALDESLT